MTRASALALSALIAATSLTPLPTAAQSAGQRSTVAMTDAPQLVNLPRGTSFAIDLPSDARDVIVSNPTVAEAMLHSPRRITVIGLAPGETDAVFLDAAGRSILTLRVRVDAGVGALQDTLSRVVPGSDVRAEAVNDSIILTGLVTSPAEAERVAAVARAFVSAPEKVLNMVSVAGSDQITLKVRVIEVQRSVIKQLGISSDLTFNTGSQSTGFSRQNTFGANGGLLGGGGACFNQDRARTRNFSSSDISTNQTSSGSNTSNTTTNTFNNTSTNTITNTTSNGSNTTLTTSDGRTITFNGDAPGAITVVDFNGNTVTLTGQNAADYLRSTISGTSLTSSVAGTFGSTVASSLISIIGSTITGNSGNSVSNVLQNVASSAFQTVTGNNANACIEAFERVGLIRTLAEPNLTSVNGEDASFLAGGEFPTPGGRDRDGNVTIEYKPYGVSLAFRPIVLSEGRISLQIAAEVSELTNQGGFTIGAGTPSSITLPGLSVRRVENTVELPSGGAMMIAGMLQEISRQTVDSLPGLTNLPILGGLMRSRDFLNGETELVIIVEPYIVSPTSPGRLQTPADGLRIANDGEGYLLGQVNRPTLNPSAETAAAEGWNGPVGYVID